MYQPVDQTWNGGAPISNGGAGTTAPPAGDDPGRPASAFQANAKVLPRFAHVLSASWAGDGKNRRTNTRSP